MTSGRHFVNLFSLDFVHARNRNLKDPIGRVDIELVVLKLFEGALQILSHFGMHPVRELLISSSAWSPFVQKDQNPIANWQFLSQHFQKTCEVLYGWCASRYQVVDDSLSFISRNAVIHTNKFGEYPVKGCRDKRCILLVRVYAIGQMRGISFISDVVHARGSRYSTRSCHQPKIGSNLVAHH